MNDTPTNSRRSWRWLALVPGLAGLLAVLLYQLQGGLGGGQAQFDRAIPLLELPASLLLVAFEPPPWLERYPLIPYLLLPTAVNIALGLLVARAVGARRRAAVASPS